MGGDVSLITNIRDGDACALHPPPPPPPLCVNRRLQCGGGVIVGLWMLVSVGNGAIFLFLSLSLSVLEGGGEVSPGRPAASLTTTRKQRADSN